jgi:hypothetical protein
MPSKMTAFAFGIGVTAATVTTWLLSARHAVRWLYVFSHEGAAMKRPNNQLAPWTVSRSSRFYLIHLLQYVQRTHYSSRLSQVPRRLRMHLFQ